MGEFEEFAEALLDQISVEIDEEKEIAKLSEKIDEDKEFPKQFKNFIETSRNLIESNRNFIEFSGKNEEQLIKTKHIFLRYFFVFLKAWPKF